MHHTLAIQLRLVVAVEVKICLFIYLFIYYTLLQNNIHVCITYVKYIQSIELRETFIFLHFDWN